MIIQKLKAADVLDCPKWLPDSTQYLTIMGSMAYGVNNDESDMDVYGFVAPPKEVVFPHHAGIILGFGDQGERFENWQQHHIIDPSTGKEYDFQLSSIVKYFELCRTCNPNMIDSMFTPDNCVLHATTVAKMVRENRKLFLHKGAWHKFKGYAFSQMQKIKGGANRANPKRQASVAEHGYDVKFGYHVVRLMNEVEQIMIEGDLDLLRNREQLKSIRRGEWSLERLQTYFEEKERSLEEVYAKSTLRHSPDTYAIKALLMNCLEEHYGDLSTVVQKNVEVDRVLRDMR